MATRWKYSPHCLFLFSQICYQTCRNHLQINWILQQLPNTAESFMKRCMKSSQTLTQTDQSIDNNKITGYEPSRVMSGSSPAYRHLPSETTSTIFHALGKMHVLKVVYFDLFVAVALWVLSCRAMSALLRPVSFWLVLISPCSQLWSQSIRSLQRINIQQKTYLARYSHETSTYVLRYCTDRMVLSDSTWVRLLLILKQLCVN